jgi:hypothetical protein
MVYTTNYGGFRFHFSRKPMTHSTETSGCEEDVGDAGELVHDDVAAGCTLLHQGGPLSRGSTDGGTSIGMLKNT